MLVDAHCHLQDMKNIEEIIGKVKCVVTGYSINSNEKCINVAKRYNLPYAIGIAPQTVLRIKDVEKELLLFEEQLKNKPNAVGEIGLDFHWAKNEEQRNRQKKVFEALLEIANSHNFPVVIHSRKSEEEVIEILMSYDLRVMFHFWSGKFKHARMAFENLKSPLFSILGLPSKDREKVVTEYGLQYLTVETDSPYVFRSPLDVVKSIDYISSKLNISREDVAEATTNNAKKFFGF